MRATPKAGEKQASPPIGNREGMDCKALTTLELGKN